MSKKTTPSILEMLEKGFHNGETMEGHIHLREQSLDKLQEATSSDDKVSVFTLRLPKALNDRFETATKLKSSTKSKVLRSLIEFYIVESEAELENNPIAKILTLPAEEQIAKLSDLSPQDQLLFFEMKKQAEDNKALEDKINKKKAL